MKIRFSKMKPFTLLIVACILTDMIASEGNESGIAKKGKFS